MEARKMLCKASYFAFTATPKNRTLEIFGKPVPDGDKVRQKPFHSYTMKQAIQEGFILDVLASYTPVESYTRLMKAVADDPELDTKRATKKLRRYVESHDHAIRQKAEIMVDHFHRMTGDTARNLCRGAHRNIIVLGSKDLRDGVLREKCYEGTLLAATSIPRTMTSGPPCASPAIYRSLS